MSFLIGKNGKIDCAGDMIFCEFRRRADIDDLTKLREGKWEGDSLGELHWR